MAKKKKAAAQPTGKPSAKAPTPVPTQSGADIQQQIRTQVSASQRALDDLIRRQNLELMEIESSRFGEDAAIKFLAEQEAANVPIEVQFEQAMQEGQRAEKEGDTAITALVEAGLRDYGSLTPELQKAVGEMPQYKNAGVAAATAVLQSLGVEGMADIMNQIREEYPDISSDDALMLAKFDPRFNGPYMKRFAGNKALMDAGFAPMDDKEYLATERAFDKIFSAYELGRFNTRDRFAKLIGSRVSADELAERVSLAADRVMKGATETRSALQQLYPELTVPDLIAYAIDPVNQLPVLQRKVQAAELGGAALAQSLTIGLDAAPKQSSGYTNVQREGLGISELMAQGTTLEAARKGYAAVAEVLPTAEKLSAIYGDRMEQYGRKQAEEEQFKQLASAKRARQKLTAAELAAFSGESGLGAQALTRERFV